MLNIKKGVVITIDPDKAMNVREGLKELNIKVLHYSNYNTLILQAHPGIMHLIKNIDGVKDARPLWDNHKIQLLRHL